MCILLLRHEAPHLVLSSGLHLDAWPIFLAFRLHRHASHTIPDPSRFAQSALRLASLTYPSCCSRSIQKPPCPGCSRRRPPSDVDLLHLLLCSRSLPLSMPSLLLRGPLAKVVQFTPDSDLMSSVMRDAASSDQLPFATGRMKLVQ